MKSNNLGFVYAFCAIYRSISKYISPSFSAGELKKVPFFFTLLLLVISAAHSQVTIKSKLDAQTYSDYSKTIDLLEKNISSDSVFTIFVPINYALSWLGETEQKQIFEQNSKLSVEKFIRHHSLRGLFSPSQIESFRDINTGSLLRTRAEQTLYYLSNSDRAMFTDKNLFEANLDKYFKVNDHLFLYFIFGCFSY